MNIISMDELRWQTTVFTVFFANPKGQIKIFPVRNGVPTTRDLAGDDDCRHIND